MINKKTAVEWLEDALAKNLKHIIEKNDYVLIERLFYQAKEIEKDRMAEYAIKVSGIARILESRK